MVSFDASNDLVTLLKANITMGNVAGLSTRPLIILDGEQPHDDNSGSEDSGILLIQDESMNEEDQNKANIDERYIIDATFWCPALNSSFIDMLAEFVRVLRVENQSISRSYHYKTTINQRTNLGTENSAVITFQLLREWIDVTT